MADRLRWGRAIVCFTLAVGGLSPAASGATLTTDQVGYYLRTHVRNSLGTTVSDTYSQFVDPPNYLTGMQSTVLSPAIGGGSIQIERRPYFVFDRSAVSGEVTSATFSLFMQGNQLEHQCNHAGECGYASDDLSETVVLHSLSTSPSAVLVPTGGTEAIVFDDLADGTLLGSRVVVSADADPPMGENGIWLEFELDPKAVQQINGTSGLWALGMSLSSLTWPDGPPAATKFERLFIDSSLEQSFFPDPKLVLTFAPEPSALTLFAVAFSIFLVTSQRSRKTR